MTTRFSHSKKTSRFVTRTSQDRKQGPASRTKEPALQPLRPFAFKLTLAFFMVCCSCCRSVTRSTADEEQRNNCEDFEGNDNRNGNDEIIIMESNWFLMNPRDDAVPHGCHLNLLDEEEAETHCFDEEVDTDDMLVMMRDNYSHLEDHDEHDHGLVDDLATVRHSNSHPGSSASSNSQGDFQIPQPSRTNSSTLPASTCSDPIPVRYKGGYGGLLKRTLSEEQLLAGERMAEYRDSLMFQRIVNGICRQQQATVFDHPRIVNDRCLASIISARNIATADLQAMDHPSRRCDRGSRSSPRRQLCRPTPKRFLSAAPVANLLPAPDGETTSQYPPIPLMPPTLLLTPVERQPERSLADNMSTITDPALPVAWVKVPTDPGRLLRPVTLLPALLDTGTALATAADRSYCHPSKGVLHRRHPVDGRGGGWIRCCRENVIGTASPPPSSPLMDDAIFDLEM